MPLSPEDVANKQFTSTRLGRGYDEAEVDDFLDEVEAELTRLYRENDELRSKLAQVQRSLSEAQARLARGEGGPLTGAQQIAGSHQTTVGLATGAHPVATGAHTVPPVPAQPAPPVPQAVEPAPAVPAPAPVAPMSSGIPADQAAGILALAQRTADDHVAEARKQADRIVAEAKSRADHLVREAEERHRLTLGSLETERAVLERTVEDLRTFERDYRSRLRTFIEGQLNGLDVNSSVAPSGPDRGFGLQKD